ncbi:MAG: hypothetical protein WBD20_03625 [Pirellulaceae bacterium]
MSPDPTELHTLRNNRTQQDWDSFAVHRQRTTEILRQQGGIGGKSLAILGVGNGNDIDLSQLVSAYALITLVDIDDQAIQRCLARLPAISQKQIRVLSPIDVSGIYHAQRSASNLTPEQFANLLERASNPPVTELELERYDVVASTCMLSQLIDTVHHSVPAQHPRVTELVLAVRDGHLELLSRITNPSGSLVLVSDFVSTDTWPEMLESPDDQFTSAVEEMIKRQNFFTGLNPAVLVQKLSPQSNDRFQSIRVHPPWRWRMGPRGFAVVAIEATRNESPIP